MCSTRFITRVMFICGCFFSLLAACTAEPETAVSLTATEQLTNTPQVTAVLSTPHLPTATPTTVPSPTDTISAALQIIAPENVNQLTQLAQFGNGRINNITWSPDGANFVVGTSNDIHFYDVETLQRSQTIDTTGYLGAMHFSPNGDALVTIGCGVPICDTSSSALWHPLPSAARMPAFTPDGQTVVFAEQVSEEMWQLAWQEISTGENQASLELSYEPLAFSLVSKLVVGMEPFGAGDKLHLYDMFSEQLLHTLEAVSTANEATRTAYNAQAQGDGGLFPGLEPTQIVFSPQGNLVAAGSYDHVVYVWDVQSGELLYSLSGHTSFISPGVFNADGRILATGSRDERIVQLWDTITGQLLQTFSGGWQAAFDPDMGIVAIANDSHVAFYDVETGQLLHSLSGYNSYINSIAISPDGRTLAAAEDQLIALWDIESQQLIRTIDGNDLILSVTFSPDGETLAWGGNLGVTLWDLKRDQLVGNFQENDNQVGKVLFNPDGRLLTAVSSDSVLRVWDADTLTVLFSQPDIIVNHVAFHPSEPILAVDRIITTATGWKWQLQNLNLESLQWINSFANVGPIVAFTLDGLLLAADGSQSEYSPIGAWDIVTGQRIRQITDPVYNSTFHSSTFLSPNGQFLALYPEAFPGLSC